MVRCTGQSWLAQEGGDLGWGEPHQVKGEAPSILPPVPGILRQVLNYA